MFAIAIQLQGAKELYSNGNIVNSLNKYYEVLTELKQQSGTIATLPDVRSQIFEIEQIIKNLTELQSAYNLFCLHVKNLVTNLTNVSLDVNLSAKIAFLIKVINVFTAQSHEKLGDLYSELFTDVTIAVECSPDNAAAFTNYTKARDLYTKLFMMDDDNRINNKMGLGGNNKSSKRKADEIDTADQDSLVEGTTYKQLKIALVSDLDPKTTISFNSEYESRTYIIQDPYKEGEKVEDTKAPPVPLGSPEKSNLKVKDNEIGQSNVDNNLTTISSSQLLPIFLAAIHTLSDDKNLSHALIGRLLQIIGHYHLQFHLDITFKDIGEPFPKNLVFGYEYEEYNPDSQKMEKRIINKTARELLICRPVLKAAFDCVYRSAMTYGNEEAYNELFDYSKMAAIKKGKVTTFFAKHHYKYNLKKINPVDSHLSCKELLLQEVTVYCTQLEILLMKYPEMLDQYLLRLCAFIGDSFSVNEDKVFAPIFDLAREKMQNIVPIKTGEEFDLTSDFESESESGSESESESEFEFESKSEFVPDVESSIPKRMY